MATIASLNVLLGVNSAQFQRGMAASAGTVRNFERTSRRSFGGIQKAYLALAGVFAGAQLTSGITRAADTLTNINNQLRAAGIEASGLANAQANVVALADQTRSSLQATGGLYARILRSSRELGVSQQQALQITRAFQQTLALSGAETSEAQAAALQFGQALASGRLQGDELRSILENNSFFAQEFARELGVGVGQLREMGKNGELTSELLADVALRIAPRINQQFQGLNATFGQAGQVLRNRLTLGMASFGEAVRDSIGDVTGLARSVGDTLQAAFQRAAQVVRILAANGEAVRTIMISLGTVVGAFVLPRFLALATAITGALAQALLFLISPIGTVVAALVSIGIVTALAFDEVKATAAAAWDFIAAGAQIVGLSIEEYFTNAANNVVVVFEGAVNGIIGAINFAIRQLNRASNALGGGNIASELGLFGGDPGSSAATERLKEIRAQLQLLKQDAADAAAGIASGVAGIGGVLGESVDQVQGLIDQLFGGTEAPTLPGVGPLPGLPAPDGQGINPGNNNPLTFSKDQSDRLGQSVYDGINRGLTGVLSGQGGFKDFALSVVSSIQSSLIESLADNLTDAIKGFFKDFDFGGLFGGGGGGGLFGGIFHNGGVVPGRSGQDVPIIAQAGEVVLTQAQQQALLSGRAGSQTLNQTIQVTGDVTEATRRAVREMSGEIASNTRSHFVEQGVV